jgi:hypothetical protein
MIQPAIEDINNLPVNRKAEKMLLEIGAVPDPQSLFCVQLALWAIEKALVEVDESVAETANAMLTWRPARLMNFLTLQGSDDHDAFAGCEASQTPQDLAFKVIEIIENRMMIHFPWYFNVE